MNGHRERMRDIFDKARRVPKPERAAILDGLAASDAPMRAQIEDMLAALDEAGAFLSDPTAHLPSPAAQVATFGGRVASVVDPLREGPGTRIGPYKLLQQIGEGGFGSVFMAEQEKPVARKVALKIIKLGMDTRQVVARFEAERQALAMMDHPNIARVLDAGATETGRPFFVMELVKGDPIVEYCDKNNLSIQDRLELFAQVCNAVQHAHTKGIIHRDIKPSNILVSTQDGRPHTKVIDFGIAKATASRLTEKTLFTEHRQLIGTPEYMSPEQAEGSMDIDTRTDVYSLGVLLYELLTGTTPFGSQDLRSAAYAEIQRIIREVEPPKPSTRLSQNTDTIAGVAARRHTEPKRLGTIVRGELDWIVMKSLEKDRQRRYETANGLAMDIRRYLAGEAVVAAPPSTAYRFKKFIRRNRGIVTAGCAVALALLIGVVAFAWQAEVASDQRDIAVKAQQAEVEQRKAAEAARQQAEKIAEFLGETLSGAAPSVALGRDTAMLKDLMDAAAARIEKGDMKSAPEAELRLRGTIGCAYVDLAAFDAAQRMLEPAVALARLLHPDDHLATAEAIGNMASLLYNRREPAKALPLAREALDMTRRLLPGDHKEVANALHELAMTHRSLGDEAKAESLMLDALEMNRHLSPGGSAEVADSLTNLAGIRQQRYGGWEHDMEPLCREALAMYRSLYPADHPQVAYGAHNLASVLESRGDHAGAALLLREAFEICERIYPPDHPIVRYRLENWLRAAIKLGDLGEAEPQVLERYLRLRERPTTAEPLTIEQQIQAMERVVRLYEAKGNEPEAAAWRIRLEAVKAEQAKSAAQSGK